MGPDCLCSCSERPRTVTHLTCARKLSGLRLLLLPRCVFLSRCQMYPHSKATNRSVSLPFARGVLSPARQHKPPHIPDSEPDQPKLGWTCHPCPLAVVEEGLHLMNRDVLKCILKYGLFSAMLPVKSTCAAYKNKNEEVSHSETSVRINLGQEKFWFSYCKD